MISETERRRIDGILSKLSRRPTSDGPAPYKDVFLLALLSVFQESQSGKTRAWVARMLEKYADTSDLSPQETIAAQNEIARRIPCFNPKDAAKLAPIEKALARRNDTLGVDSLVAQFNALSPAAKKQFLQKIQAQK